MSDKFDKYNRYKIQQKVADLLGIDENDESLSMEVDPGDSLVPRPDPSEIAVIDNPELPALDQELMRLEHGQRKQEALADRGECAVVNMLNDLDRTPPMYKPKTALAVAEIYKAVADLRKATIKGQLEIIETKMKMASFVRNKNAVAAPQAITGNTIIFNREDLIKKFSGGSTDNDENKDKD